MGVYSHAKPVGMGRGFLVPSGRYMQVNILASFCKGDTGPGRGSLPDVLVAILSCFLAIRPHPHIQIHTLYNTQLAIPSSISIF